MATKALEPILPNPKQDSVLEDVRRVLAEFPSAALVGPNDERTPIPEALYLVLQQAVAALQRGQAVVVVPENQELTTQQAADLLNVSRPFLIKLLERGEIPFRMAGTHRRIELRELMNYKSARSERRRSALSEMARNAESHEAEAG